MTITADTASERTYLLHPKTMKNKLLLADAGYVDFGYFDERTKQGRFLLFEAEKHWIRRLLKLPMVKEEGYRLVSGNIGSLSSSRVV